MYNLSKTPNISISIQFINVLNFYDFYQILIFRKIVSDSLMKQIQYMYKKEDVYYFMFCFSTFTSGNWEIAILMVMPIIGWFIFLILFVFAIV